MFWQKKYVVILLLCATLIVCLSSVRWGWNSQASSKVAWEYKVIRIDRRPVGEPEVTMNKLGAEGWELVQIVHPEEVSMLDGYFLFKRVK